MVTNGLTPDQAVTVQKQAARLYRGLRMCEAAKTELATRSKLSLDGVDIEDSKKVEEKNSKNLAKKK
jgi:hypothetical protein